MEFQEETNSCTLMVDLGAKPITLVRISPVALELPEEGLKATLSVDGTVQGIVD